MSHKCQALKKNGKQCTNNAKKGDSCGIESHIIYMRKQQGLHNPNKQKYTPLYIANIDPGATNLRSVVVDIDERLVRGPSDRDKSGYIYMYYIKGDASPMYRKVGRTERLPERRMEEWTGGTLLKSWQCKRNRMAEYLIHKYLDYVRVDRLLIKDKYVSVWQRSKQFVADKNYIGGDDVDGAYKKAKKKDIEWFKEDEKIIVEIIQIVTRAINKHF